MKTKLEHIATIIAAAVWADGHYDPAEAVTVDEIAEALELNQPQFKEAVEKIVKGMEELSDNMTNAALLDAAEAVDDKEIGIVFEAAMQMLMADGELNRGEISNLLVIADALGIETEDAILLLADMVKTEDELTINFD